MRRLDGAGQVAENAASARVVSDFGPINLGFDAEQSLSQIESVAEVYNAADVVTIFNLSMYDVVQNSVMPTGQHQARRNLARRG